MIRFLRFLAAATLVSPAGALVAAEPYPTRPVHLISPFNAGTGPDASLRVLAVSLSDSLGQPVVVENRPGGVGGVISYQSVARARADGYMVLAAYNGLAILKHIQPDAAVDPLEDFAPITGISRGGGTVLLVRGDSPAMQLADFVARLKANQGKFNYASSGIATPAHLAAATLLAVTGTSALHIPYKGGGDPAVMAVLRGEVEFAMPAISFALPHLKSGKLRALGGTGEARFRELPDVPMLRESLNSELLVQDSWGGLFAPAKTPHEVINKIHAATVKALGGPALQKAIESRGSKATPSRSPEEFAAFVRREYQRWGEIVKRSGVRAE